MISLYPDQEEFLIEIKKLWKEHKRIVAMACTGFGKTRVSARIIEGCVKNGISVCFLVPRISLIEQTARSFRELGLDDITYLWADYDTDVNAMITIASVDTYIRREKREFGLTLVDEMHHKREQLCNWMEEHSGERYIGLSATPFGDWIGEFYTGLAKSKSMRWLIDNGRLAPYEIYAPSSPDLKGVKVVNTPQGKDYQEAALERIMGEAKVVGNIVKNWLENGENRLTMALCVNVSHANHLCLEFNKSGVPSEVISANVPVEEREAIFDRMRSGVTKIVLSVNCLTEGFDLPQVSCLINARPTKSKARWSQGAGRALRYLPGKTAIIFDHSGTSIGLGFPEDMTIDELGTGGDAETPKSVREEKEKTEKLPKECGSCHYLKPAGCFECPKCGFKPMVGEDVEVDETRGLTKIKGDKKAEPTMADKQQFYSELLGFSNERKLQTGKEYAKGWLANQYKNKFKVWPRGLSDKAIAPSQSTRNYIKAGQIRYAKSRAKNES